MTGGPGYIRTVAPCPTASPEAGSLQTLSQCCSRPAQIPNAKAPDGNTLLHQAAQAGNLDMISALAEAKVKFDQTNNDGLTALDVAEGKRPARRRCAPVVAVVAQRRRRQAEDAVAEVQRRTDHAGCRKTAP